MAKRITLPLGLSIGEVSAIGQYALVSPRVYDFTNIKMSEIRNTLGESTYDLKTLCLSSNINKWAAFKPNRGSGYDPSGMGIESGSPNNIVYLKPTDAFGYVMGHFAGYNHNANTPGEWESALPTYGSGGEQEIEAPLTLPEFDLRDINASIDGVISDVSGAKTFMELTDTEIGERAIAVKITLNCDINAVSTSATVVVTLGYLSGSTPTTYCNFPHAGTGQLSKTLTAYNISVPTLSGTYYPESEEDFASIYLDWAARSTEVIQAFELERSETSSSSGFTKIYDSHLQGYFDYDITVPSSGNKNYWYRVRMRYKNGTSFSSYSNVVNVIVPAP
jgi:hypothetical protein